MNICFDNEFETVKEIVLDTVNYFNITAITIVRDVFGKVAILVEPKEGTLEVNELGEKLISVMGDFYSGQIYIDGNEDEDNFIKLIINDIKRSRTLYLEDQNLLWYILERPLAKKAWTQLNRQAEPAWPYEAAFENEFPKLITFYSFKGGMGRTTALAGVAMCLASKNKNVVIVDTDVEAPGISTLFFPDDMVEAGLLDYMIEKPLNHNIDMRKYLLEVRDYALTNGMEGQIHLMPAGKVDKNYLQKLARVDFQDNRPGYLKTILIDLLNDIRISIPNVDYIILDARAGFHDMGGIVTAELPHGVVLFGNNTVQSWNGMNQVISTVANCQKEPLPVAIINSLCPNVADVYAEDYRKSFLDNSYNSFIEYYYSIDDPAPAINASDEPHSPIDVPWDTNLRANFSLYTTDDAKSQQIRVMGLKELLMGKPYQSILNRIELWFGV